MNRTTTSLPSLLTKNLQFFHQKGTSPSPNFWRVGLRSSEEPLVFRVTLILQVQELTIHLQVYHIILYYIIWQWLPLHRSSHSLTPIVWIVILFLCINLLIMEIFFGCVFVVAKIALATIVFFGENLMLTIIKNLWILIQPRNINRCGGNRYIYAYSKLDDQILIFPL